jgi:hypothetical protein
MDEIFKYTFKDFDFIEEITIYDGKENNVVVTHSSGDVEEYTFDYIDIEAIKNTILDYNEIFEIDELPNPPEEGPTSIMVFYDEDEPHEIIAENLKYWDLEDYVDSSVQSVVELIYTISDVLNEYGIDIIM